MSRFVLTFLVAALLSLASTASADVVISFDTDTGGFVDNNAGNGGVGTVTHALVNGEGMLCLQTTGGWDGNFAQLAKGVNTAWDQEWNDAVANGGSVSFDVFIQETDQVYTANPGWFNPSVVGQSVWDNTDNWDGENHSIGVAGGNWPTVGGTFSAPVSYAILGASSAGTDQNMQIESNPATSFENFYLGLSSDNTGILTQATYYVDNLTVSANLAPVPEPSSLAIVGLACLGLMARRRR